MPRLAVLPRAVVCDPSEEVNWPLAHLPRIPLRRCAVIGCENPRCFARRGDLDVARRWCVNHAMRYDFDRFQSQVLASVFDIHTGERFA